MRFFVRITAVLRGLKGLDLLPQYAHLRFRLSSLVSSLTQRSSVLGRLLFQGLLLLQRILQLLSSFLMLFSRRVSFRAHLAQRIRVFCVLRGEGGSVRSDQRVELGSMRGGQLRVRVGDLCFERRELESVVLADLVL
jgi:hypothetical protein